MNERLYWLGFSVFPGIGPGRFKLLIDKFGFAKDAWKASFQDLKNVIGEKLTLDFEKFRSSFLINNYSEKLKEKDVWFLTQKDPGYPSLLLQTNKPPILLFGRGESSLLSGSCQKFSSRQCSSKSSKLERLRAVGSPPTFATPNDSPRRYKTFDIHIIAIVGTRKISSYGREATEILTRELVQSGFTIVSGLALGVDALAHKTAIENGGKTVAVLGCGADICYPLSNKKLYDEIINGNGAVISEFPLGFKPSKGSFPSRNRIIAGLSMGVLVTEGAEDSGALITADYAIKYQRKVFAVPGPITSGLSRGPHKLLEKGAKLVTNTGDILKEFQISSIRQAQGKFQIYTNDGMDSGQARMTSKFQNLTEEEKKILQLLQNEALHFDEIVRKSRFDSSKLGGLLTMMEIKGMIRSLESGYFSINSKY